MSNLAKLRERLTSEEQQTVKGYWRPIRACLDEDAGEFLNVGVLFQHGSKVDVRMLDSFDRVNCLYNKRIDLPSLSHLMMDIEDTIRQHPTNLPAELSDTIHLGAPLFACGADPESVVDEFFNDVVTLAMPVGKQRNYNFRYRSTHKVRETVFEIMREKMALNADRVIGAEPYRLHLKNKAIIDVDVPLLSSTAAGGVVSAWYKSPLVVEHNLLQAASDLMLVSSNSDRTHAALSVLMPNATSGMSAAEFNKHQDATRRQLERVNHMGIEIIEAHSSDALANQTIEWWKGKAA